MHQSRRERVRLVLRRCDQEPCTFRSKCTDVLRQVQFAGNYFYDTGIYLPKLAILALYNRLFPPTMPWLRKLLYAVSTFTVLAMITTCFLDTFWCGGQVSVNWSLDDDACSTFNSKVVFRVDWVMNIATDVFSEFPVFIDSSTQPLIFMDSLRIAVSPAVSFTAQYPSNLGSSRDILPRDHHYSCERHTFCDNRSDPRLDQRL